MLLPSPNMAEPMSLLGPAVGLVLLIYVGFCFAKGGTHVKGKGWMTKEEAPKTYIFSQVLYIILANSMIFGEFLAKIFR